MAAMQEYKCPCCGGAIAFDSTAQKMVCPYCDTEFELEALAGFDQDLAADAPDEMTWTPPTADTLSGEEAEGLNAFVCKSCGGELVTDANTVATTCPFCDNPVVMTGRAAGALKPDLVIPFKVDKKAAKEGLNRHLQGKTLLPKVFRDQNHIDEIKGVYVPFWLFDADVDGQMRFRATRTRAWSDSRYNYVETSYFSVMRGGSLRFNAVPVDGSAKIEDQLMESIEPYDLSQAVDFRTAYLAGYLADKYDVAAEDTLDRASQRIRNSTERMFARTVQGYSSVVKEAGNVHLASGKPRYALLPVWLLNTTWNGQRYTFAMNGQTGKFVGDLPVDKAASNRWLLSIAGIGTAALFALSYLIWLL